MRKALTKFQKFLRDHVLLVGLAAVLVPLLSLLVLQYWSLSKLERASTEEEQTAVIVTAYDEKGSVVFSTQLVKGRGDESWVRLPPSSGWRLAVSSSSQTPEQWAQWNFKLSLTLSVLMTLALLAAVFLALRAAQREIKLSQMKTDFVSNVSHELRTPLASIRVFGEFLRMGRVQEQETVRKYGEYIETESQRLTQLVGNILDFSRSESGRKTYSFAPADVSDLVRVAVKTFDVQLRQHGFALKIKEPPRPLPAIFVDAAAITQALLNLLDNAVKYSGSSREIEVWLGQESNFVTVAVRDRGIGLSRKDQQKVFDKFYRVCRGLVHESRGSGLGLTLVKQIVKAHRGRIVVESQLGRGSTFRMYLPVKEKLTEGTVGRGHGPPAGSGPVLQSPAAERANPRAV